MASTDAAVDAAVRTPLEVYLGWAAAAIRFTIWPLIQILHRIAYSFISFALSVLNTLYKPLAFLLQPIFYLAHFALIILGLPFRLLVQLEPLYIYFSIAALIGIFAGLVLAIVYRLGHSLLRLNSPSKPAPRSAKQYREAKHRQKASTDLSSVPSSPSGLISDYLSLSDEMRRGKRGRGLMAQTIAEEDSDF